MGLNYPEQTYVTLIGSKSGTTRTSATLVATYDDAALTKIFETGGFSKLNLNILYTMGATETTNSIEIRVDNSDDRTNWYRLPNEAVSSGTSTLTAREFTFVGADAAAATISIGLDVFYKYMRISLKETGKATNFGTVFVEGLLSGA